MDIDDDDDSGSSNSGDSGPDETVTLCISHTQWVERLEKIDVSKRIMDKIIMNYFVIEGHYEAAQTFQKESGTGNGEIVRSMGERVAIVSLIKSGKIAEAIDRLNELESDILNQNETLCFQLKCQQLIELIRSGDLQNALIFAQQNLAPRALSNANFLKDVEDIMSLFVFDDVNNCPLAHLVSQPHRSHLANLVNVAILERFGQNKESKLLGLLRRLMWTEDRLENIPMSFPKFRDLLSDTPDEHRVCDGDRMEKDY